jgi:hypothetical protein
MVMLLVPGEVTDPFELESRRPAATTAVMQESDTP